MAEAAVIQIRSVDKSRIGERLDILESSAASELRHVITAMYGVLAV